MILITAIMAFPWNIPYSARWFERYNLVAHAGGVSPTGNIYANSLEAFESNYQKGHRVFEGDLCFTSDGILVLEHDWSIWFGKMGQEYAAQIIDYQTFMNNKFWGTDTPMDLQRLIQFMIEHDDMYFMTDFKDCYSEKDVTEGFRQIVQEAQEASRMDILDRFIIQNHHNDFKHWVDKVYPFRNWLYTYYSAREQEQLPENMVAYCVKEGIPVITMPDYLVNDEWLELTRANDIRVFVHAVNDIDWGNTLLSMGVAGLYTAVLTPS